MESSDIRTPHGGHSAERYSFSTVPQLSSALRKGDEAAFRWLHEQWNSRLQRYCFTLARGDDALANDLVQATYLRILRHIRPLPDEAALWAWIAKAARSAAADQHRVGSRYRKALSNLSEWIPHRKKEQEPDHSHPSLFMRLDTALASLDKEEQHLIELRYFKQIPLVEIGTSIGCSTRAVEGRLARLRKKIQQCIRTQMQAEAGNEDG